MLQTLCIVYTRLQSDTCLRTLGLSRKKKEKIKFPDAYARGSFSPPYEAVGLPLEGGWAAVETMYRKRKVSSGAELGALGQILCAHIWCWAGYQSLRLAGWNTAGYY